MVVIHIDSNKTFESNEQFFIPLNYGRQRIILDYDEVTPENFLEVLTTALPIYRKNQSDCEYLINVFLGNQDILSRPAPNTSNINNKTVVNYAYPITREIVGYTFGRPFELVAKNTEKQQAVQDLSDICDYKDTYVVDISAALYGSICGIGYEITIPSPDINKDNIPDIPLVVDSLDPRYTFVVQSTSVGHKQIMSCMEVLDSNGNTKRFIAFTDKYKFTIENIIGKKPDIKYEKNPIGIDPIVMIENSLFLTGDWEQALSVLNAINQVTSDSLNEIEGTIKSLLVLLGCEIDDPETALKTIKDKRLLSLANGDGQSGNLDAKFIAPKLDNVGVENVRQFLEDARNVITGIPDRSANSSGGDTGQAVLNRDGWTDIELVARLKELFFKKAKKKQVDICLKILQSLSLVPKELSSKDISINVGRDTLDNLSTKATAFATLVATGELATIDCLALSNLTNRVSEVVERGKQAKEEKRKESLEYMKEEAALNGDGYKVTDADVNSAEKSS